MNNYGAVIASPYRGYNTTVPGIGPGRWNRHALADAQELHEQNRRILDHRFLWSYTESIIRVRAARRAYLADGGL